MLLNPVKYRYKHQNESENKSQGFIAQDVKQIFPDLVHTEDGSQLALAYSDFAVISIKAIQELNAKLKSKDQELEVLKQRLDEKDQQFELLMKEIQTLKGEE